MKTAFGLLSVHRFRVGLGQGKTKEEALENVRDAINLCLQAREEQGLPLTIETKQVEVAA